jgi:hypothetical protein
MDVVFGRGHTIWKFADCTLPDRDGRQACAVDPDVVAARAAGLSYGFCVYDEVGSIWSIKKNQFKYTYFPNRLCYSKESGITAPYLEVWVKGTDDIPPEPVKTIRVDIEQFPTGEALVFWNTPKDYGGGQTLGFNIYYKRGDQEKQIPRYLIPMAGKAGEEVRMHIHDLPFKPGEMIALIIKSVDSAGNVSQPFIKTIQLSSNPRSMNVPKADINPFSPNKELPTVGNIKVAVVDLLDKIDPKTGDMIPAQREGYKGGNHIYSAKERLIRLQSARNEHVAFQVNLDGTAKEVFIHYAFDQSLKLKPKVFEVAYVNIVDNQQNVISVLPDPLIPLTGTCSVPSTAGKLSIPNQTNHSLICELYVPHEESSGKKKGRVIISVGEEVLELEVNLTVWDFTLPNKLSFIPEMNAYGTVSPYKGYEYYRLAHEHRTCINRLPCGWHGIPDFAPGWKDDNFDWLKWDKKVGPLLDGSAFNDLPRKCEPVDVLYLPFSENWPVSIFDNYNPSYWADEAFTAGYGEALKKAFSAFAGHCDEKKWHKTIFQFYLNNKVNYREKYHRSSAPWVFDEPANTQDFWALRWYGLLWHSAVDKAKGDARMWYRGDISYSQFGRNMLWGLMDVEYFGGNNAQKTRMKHDEQILYGKSYFFEYGSPNNIQMPNSQPAAWCLSVWSKGAMGVLPWQTMGCCNSWKNAEQTALFYPYSDGPKPSVRLKAFTRGQQDVEYLTLLCDVYQKPRYAVASWLDEVINFRSRTLRSSETDAGMVKFDKIDATKLWEIRYRVGKMISDKSPRYKRALVNWETPQRDITKLPEIGYVPVAPHVDCYKPDCDNSRPAERHK